MILSELIKVIDRDTEIDVWGVYLGTKDPVLLDLEENLGLEDARVISVVAISSDLISIQVEVEVVVDEGGTTYYIN